MRILLTMLMLFQIDICIAQHNEGPDIIKLTDSVLAKYKLEKVYLHLDKHYYAAGQTIWFKAYVIDGAGQPSVLSRVLYTELIDENNRITQNLRLPLTSGLASGDFQLPDTLEEGNYRIRAYTRWMRNFGEEQYYDRLIRIGNNLSNQVLTHTTYTASKETNAAEAQITYTSLEGSILANQEVSYSLEFNNRLQRGKGRTDGNGTLTINLPATAGTLTTTINHNNQPVTMTIPVRVTTDQIDIQFFPEGGQLVDSIPSRVAFKANRAGLGIPVSGYITDGDTVRLASIKTEHAGMGSFILTPFTGHSYTAVINLPDGKQQRIPLPVSQLQGYVLTLMNNDPDQLRFRVKASRNQVQNGQLMLVARTSGQMYEVSRFTLNRQYADLIIPNAELPTGIVQFTLFDQMSQPVAERLVFIRHYDELKLDITTNKAQYGTREKVRMELTAIDAVGKAVPGSFSVAVTRVPVVEEEEHTILSTLLLTSELKGYIEKPNYYFTDTTGTKRAHLDNLLLTQGWRRFTWKQVQDKNYPKINYAAEGGIAIGGLITNHNKPVKNGRVTLFSPKAGLSLDTVTNSEGRFMFKDLVFTDSTRFVIQARTERDGKNVKIEPDRVIPPLVIANLSIVPDIEVDVNSSMLPYLKDTAKELAELREQGLLEHTQVLKEVTVTAQRDDKKVQFSSKLGNRPADVVIKEKDFNFLSSVQQAIQGKVNGLNFYIHPKTGSTYAYLTRNTGIKASSTGPIAFMKVFLDGVLLLPERLDDTEVDLQRLDVSNLAAIEVLTGSTNTALYGNQGIGGVLLLTSKRFASEDLPETETAKGIISFQPKGYYLGRDFYAPRYDDSAAQKDIKDLRSTIYWNANVPTSKEAVPSFDFFTTDMPGRYRTVVEGMDYMGRLARKVTFFIVK